MNIHHFPILSDHFHLPRRAFASSNIFHDKKSKKIIIAGNFDVRCSTLLKIRKKKVELIQKAEISTLMSGREAFRVVITGANYMASHALNSSDF